MYVGEFYDDRRHGHGVITLPDKTIETQFYEDRMDKEVQLTYKNGDFYEGEHVDGTPNGKGRMKYSDGRVFTGLFNNGFMVKGKLELVSKNEYYVGEFENNLFNGHGEYYYADGTYYKGEWTDGVRDGLGTYTTPDMVYVGEFRDDKISGRGEQRFKNGNVYTGEFLDGKRDGYGQLRSKDGNIFEGNWKQNEQDGDGKTISAFQQNIDDSPTRFGLRCINEDIDNPVNTDGITLKRSRVGDISINRQMKITSRCNTRSGFGSRLSMGRCSVMPFDGFSSQTSVEGENRDGEISLGLS